MFFFQIKLGLFMFAFEIDDRQQQQQQEEDDSFMDFELYVYLAFVVPLVSYWVWGTWLYKAFY